VRKLLIAALACLCTATLAAIGGGTAHAAASGCTGTFQVTSITFDKPSVNIGQNFNATAVIQNCTAQPQTWRGDWRAHSVEPSSVTPYYPCTANDPYPMPEVQIAPGATYTNTTPWTIFPNCPATAIQLTVYSWDFGALAVGSIPVGSGASSPPPPSSCTANYHNDNEWSSGFVARVTVTNGGSAAVNHWSVRFTYPGDQQVTSSWNAVVQQSGNVVSATDAAWDGTIPAGGSVAFGLYGTWHASDALPVSLTCQAS
jgi:cellulase/cellobiase CelA1